MAPSETPSTEPDVKPDAETKAALEKARGKETPKVVVKYTGGTTHTRILTPEDFLRVGVVGVKENLVWDKSNRHTLDISDQKKSVQEVVLAQPEFELA